MTDSRKMLSLSVIDAFQYFGIFSRNNTFHSNKFKSLEQQARKVMFYVLRITKCAYQ